MVPGAAASSSPLPGPGLSGDPTLSTTEEFAEFLRHQAPFDALGDEELRSAAATAELVGFWVGEAAVVEDGEPTRGLFVIRTGAMDLVHAGQVVDVLEPGECFGHPSLLTGLAPAFSVIAREDSTCLLIPRQPALGVLGHPAGAAFVALSLRERLVRAGHTAHALPELSLTRLGELVDRPPLVLEPDASIRQAAQAMTDARVTAALVQTRDGLRIVTDADLRAQVLAEGRSSDDSVLDVARTQPLTARSDRTAGEVLVDLLEAHRREVCVTDHHDRVIGVLAVEDIAAGEHSPFALRQVLSRAPDEDTLVSAATSGLPRLLQALISAGLAPLDVSRALTAQSDAVTARLIDFAFARHGQAPLAWAWLALGSVARREMTLASDQDNALAYADGGGPEVDEWFGRMAADVNAGLARCGFGPDNAGVLAQDSRWRMSAERWRAVFQECLEHPDRSHLVRAAVSFDFRHVAGGLEIVPPLVEITRSARAYPDFLRRMARTATDWKVALGRRGSLAVDHDGRMDLKLGGVLPIVNLARLHALSGGITISPTDDRLLAAAETGQIDAEAATSLREAFEVVSRVRLEHQAVSIRAGRPPDNHVDPRELAPLRRVGLKEALRAVAAQQKRLAIYVPLGI